MLVHVPSDVIGAKYEFKPNSRTITFSFNWPISVEDILTIFSEPSEIQIAQGLQEEYLGVRVDPSVNYPKTTITLDLGDICSEVVYQTKTFSQTGRKHAGAPIPVYSKFAYFKGIVVGDKLAPTTTSHYME